MNIHEYSWTAHSSFLFFRFFFCSRLYIFYMASCSRRLDWICLLSGSSLEPFGHIYHQVVRAFLVKSLQGNWGLYYYKSRLGEVIRNIKSESYGCSNFSTAGSSVCLNSFYIGREFFCAFSLLCQNVDLSFLRDILECNALTIFGNPSWFALGRQ